MVEFVVFVGDVEEGLGGDAAHVEAGPAQRSPLLNADSIETQLRGLDGSDVSCVGGRVPPGPPPMMARSNDLVEKPNAVLLNNLNI